MPIQNVQISTETISVKNRDGSEGTIIVRGINVADLMLVVKDHGAQLALIFGKIMENRGRPVDDAMVKGLILELASEFPEVLAGVLALAADEYNEDGVAVMRRIPTDVQAQVMVAVFKLSFSSEGSLEKLVALMVDSLAEVQMAVESVMTSRTSSTGIGDFDEV